MLGKGRQQLVGPERGQKAGLSEAWTELTATQSPQVSCKWAWKQRRACKDFVVRDRAVGDSFLFQFQPSYFVFPLFKRLRFSFVLYTTWLSEFKASQSSLGSSLLKKV